MPVSIHPVAGALDGGPEASHAELAWGGMSGADTHAGPAGPGLCQLDAGRAGDRASSGATGGGATAPAAGDVRAGGAAASASRAVPGISGAEPHLPGDLLGAVRLG